MMRRNDVPRRVWLLPPLTLAWIWASSPFAPWALSLAPLTWLYDLLYYMRYGLLGWSFVEVALAVQQSRTTGRWSRLPQRTVPVALAALAATAWVTLDATGTGWRIQLAQSRAALGLESARPAGADRHRAGFFLVDSRQFPCGDSVWVWLGQPFGAGQGIGMALVRSREAIPHTPDRDGYRFWRIDDEWWVAYQDGPRYQATLQSGAPTAAECVTGISVSSHATGLAFVRASGEASTR